MKNGRNIKNAKIRYDILMPLLLLLGDILFINLGFLFAYWLRFYSGLIATVYGIPGLKSYLHVLPIITFIYVYILKSEKLYSVKSRVSIVDEFFLLVKVGSLALLIFMAATFIYREFSYSRGLLIVSWFTLLLSLGVWRFLVTRLVLFRRKKTKNKRNLLLIGDSDLVDRLILHISGDPHWDYEIKGVLSLCASNLSEREKGIKVLGNIENIGKVLTKEKIDEVIVTDIEMSRKDVGDIIIECDKRMVEFRLVADVLGMMTSQVDMRTIDGIPLLGLKESPLNEGINRMLKRTADIVLSFVGLIILSPIFMGVALAVKYCSKGPAFYFQKRIGEDGSRFAIIKFRTMIDNAEKTSGRVWAVKDDPRRTSIGGFLRKYNIDELPQLMNVLKGEMSLVGPRPERPHFVGKFKENIPRYMARHKIKSGMTGWAQVNGLRGNTSIKERTKYDIYYIENWSLAFDLRIMFMSMFAIKNAY